MHDLILRLRRQLRRTSLQTLGYSPDFDRAVTEEVRMSGQEAELLELPVLPRGGSVDLGTAFVVGISAVGGSDVVA